MPSRKGPAYPISAQWQREVRAAIDTLIDDAGRDDVTSDKTFADTAGIGKGTLSEALKKGAIQTQVMPEINMALGWPKPHLLCTPDELEVWAAVDALDERELGKLIGARRGCAGTSTRAFPTILSHSGSPIDVIRPEGYALSPIDDVAALPTIPSREVAVVKRSRPAPRRAGTLSEKKARLVRVMLEIAALDREEYRALRSEMWSAVARSHNRKPAARLREWTEKAS